MGFFKDLKKLKQQGKEVAEAQGRPTSLVGMLKQMPEDLHNATEMLGQVQQDMQQTQHLMANGTPGKATIKNVGQTGTTINENPVAILDLEVAVEGKQPYPVQVQSAVPQVFLARLVPGGQVGVKVDPANPQTVAVDWNAPV
jgi:hypothetical protein